MTPAAPACEAARSTEHDPIRFGFGADAHIAFGDLIHTNVGGRGELLLAPYHAIVVRAGTGKVEWMDSEFDDPIYREWFVRVGYRISSAHLFGGVELGRSWYKAHWDAVDQMPAHDGSWFGEMTGTALAGVKVGPVDLGVDYTRSSGSSTTFGLFIGAGYRQH